MHPFESKEDSVETLPFQNKATAIMRNIFDKGQLVGSGNPESLWHNECKIFHKDWRVRIFHSTSCFSSSCETPPPPPVANLFLRTKIEWNYIEVCFLSTSLQFLYSKWARQAKYWKPTILNSFSTYRKQIPHSCLHGLVTLVIKAMSYCIH